MTPRGSILPLRSAPEVIERSQAPFDDEVMSTARDIVTRVENEGMAALEEFTVRYGDREPDSAISLGREVLDDALKTVDEDAAARLQRIAGRIRAFAEVQRASIDDVSVVVNGGRAGHTVTPVAAAGCYAPGGRYPLPSSVLMTAVTARVAGVAEVWVASPRATPMTLAAAAIAGADGLLVAGGAQAIAAMAFGVGGVPRCDVIVGPGNRYVSAAKQLLYGRVGIDMVAGPSELLVLADDSADPAIVAADLIAQAEHDPVALPILVTTSQALYRAVEIELSKQLANLPTADVARQALQRGGCAPVESIEHGIALSNAVAPEHLQVMVSDLKAARAGLRNFGGAFYGPASAEVFGDYGIGPNHVLPTGGTGRFGGGLSVMTFLAVRTWLELDGQPDPEVLEDVSWLAGVEGLEGHARAAEVRRK